MILKILTLSKSLPNSDFESGTDNVPSDELELNSLIKHTLESINKFLVVSEIQTGKFIEVLGNFNFGKEKPNTEEKLTFISEILDKCVNLNVEQLHQITNDFIYSVSENNISKIKIYYDILIRDKNHLQRLHILSLPFSNNSAAPLKYLSSLISIESIAKYKSDEHLIILSDGTTILLYLTAEQQEFKLMHKFSLREIEILRLVDKGFSSTEISDRLCISKHTVDTHRRNILKKIPMKNSNQVMDVLKSINIL